LGRFFDGNNFGDGRQEVHLVHYAKPNNSSNALRFFTMQGYEDRSKGSDLGFNIGNNKNTSAFYINQQDLTPKFSFNWLANRIELHNDLEFKLIPIILMRFVREIPIMQVLILSG
jgi:hypothetical protein